MTPLRIEFVNRVNYVTSVRAALSGPPPCNSPAATRLRSLNGSAGVPGASELAASVALGRSTTRVKRNPGPHGMSEGASNVKE